MAHGPIERLRRLGLLSPRLIGVHFTQAERRGHCHGGAGRHSVVHCPASNLKLGNGVAPARAMLDAGLNVALGTDGAASNNTLDLVGEMRLAALLAKGSSRDPTALDAATAVRMATLNGARALGLDSETGSLRSRQVGGSVLRESRCAGDACLSTRLSPRLCMRRAREQVSDVWVAGKHLVSDRSSRASIPTAYDIRRPAGTSVSAPMLERACLRNVRNDAIPTQRRCRRDRQVRGPGAALVGSCRRIPAIARAQSTAACLHRRARFTRGRTCPRCRLRRRHSVRGDGAQGRAGPRTSTWRRLHCRLPNCMRSRTACNWSTD